MTPRAVLASLPLPMPLNLTLALPMPVPLQLARALPLPMHLPLPMEMDPVFTTFFRSARAAFIGIYAMYSAAQIKWDDFLHPISWLSLERFLIFLDESYRARRMQAIDTKHIKIGQFV